MKKVLVFLLLAALIASCSNDKATVKLIVSDSPDSTEIVVSRLSINQIVSVDTIYTKGGKVSFSVNCVNGAPDFYYFIHDGKKIASVVASVGDVISVNTDLEGNIHSVSGSDDALLFSELDKQMTDSYSNFESVSDALIKARELKDAANEKELKTQLGKIYVQQKQAAIKYIYSHPKSITIIPAIYQKLSPDLPLFGADNDVFLLKMAYDSLRTVYPHSPYIASLADDISQKETYLSFKNKVNSATSASFPNISLYDQNAKVRNLSDYEGKIIILSFWTISDPAQKIFNNELKSIYEKYHSKGVEIYQVSIDSDKTAWAGVVKGQGLEWASVCDPGNSYQTLNLYNLTKIPALFVFDKEGNVAGKDLYKEGELRKLIGSLVK